MGSSGAFPPEMAKVIKDINNITSDVDTFPGALYSTHFGYHVPFSFDPSEKPILQPHLDVRSGSDCLIGDLPSLMDLPSFHAIADAWESPTGKRSEPELPPGSHQISSPNGRPSWLPDGWKITSKPRMNGASAGLVDKFYTEPITNKRFRSKKAVIKYLQECCAEEGNSN